jgi:small GTP-binding protein
MKIKVCMVGDAAVGKTSLVRRFVLDQFSDVYVSTFGAKIMSKELAVKSPPGEDIAVKMTIWDIIGETSLLSDFFKDYFQGAQGLVAVCDITRYTTFENLPIWTLTAEQIAGKIPNTLAINKTDLKGQVRILYEDDEIGYYARACRARHYYTSARTGENVETMFTGLAQDIVSSVGARKMAEAVA